MYSGLFIKQFERGSCTFWETYSAFKNIQIVQKVWLLPVHGKHTSRTKVDQIRQVVLIQLKFCAYM